MNPVQYIIANEGAGMSPGKLAAQVAHASFEAVIRSYGHDERQPGYLVEPNLVRLWRCGGHHAKIVLGVRDAEALRTADRYLVERGFPTYMEIDPGRTELDGLTPVAIASQVVDKDNPHVRATFKEFDLYSNPSEPEDAIVSRPKRWWRRIYDPTPLTEGQQRAERFF